MKNMSMKAILPLCAALLLSIGMVSCSSTTVINSKPPGAKLYMDGQFKGETPVTYSDTKIVGSTTTIKLVLPGFEDYNGILSRNERADVGAIIGGCFVLVPFLWTMQYDPDHTYELQSATNVTTTPQMDALSKKLIGLKKLLDNGTITKDEYDTLRKKAIDEVN